ncbi:hypothetical protein BD289DRAFT_443359 [Coniella lustricola]|uniref:KOW domain-containing protein n=1 Tax=Coniella lustricola TaxID=2025994 RepID=A0A2T2ZX37_9PEZI|nr:hypothetical protein BD289DRAFT_443359 [Coniella lustricola]
MRAPSQGCRPEVARARKFPIGKRKLTTTTTTTPNIVKPHLAPPLSLARSSRQAAPDDASSLRSLSEQTAAPDCSSPPAEGYPTPPEPLVPSPTTMQKLLKRTAQAEKQAARRIKKRNDLVKNDDQRTQFRGRMSGVVEANMYLKDARRRRHEDWSMGAIAPQRDTPIQEVKGADAFWGSLSMTRSRTAMPEKQMDLACKWAGGWKFLCLKPGDRVTIIEGPDKGKIGTISTMPDDSPHVQLEGDHLMHNTTISTVFAKSSGGSRMQLTPMVAPIQAVRLVHPLRDPATGRVRDVIINELAPTGIIRDKPTGRVTWNRVVPGLNVEIPWPRAFENAERAELERTYPDHACDTLRIDAEQATYVPTLLSPPMPAGILDELRNKYSKFRTRHDPEYIAKKEAEEAEKVALRKGHMLTMRTPIQELNAKIREEKKKRPLPELTPRMLARIGQVMARNAYRAPAVKGVTPELVEGAKRVQQSMLEAGQVPSTMTATGAAGAAGAKKVDLSARARVPEIRAPPPS